MMLSCHYTYYESQLNDFTEYGKRMWFSDQINIFNWESLTSWCFLVMLCKVLITDFFFHCIFTWWPMNGVENRFQLNLISNNYALTSEWHTWMHSFTEQVGCDIAKLFFSELWTGKYWFLMSCLASHKKEEEKICRDRWKDMRDWLVTLLENTILWIHNAVIAAPPSCEAPWSHWQLSRSTTVWIQKPFECMI